MNAKVREEGFRLLHGPLSLRERVRVRALVIARLFRSSSFCPDAPASPRRLLARFLWSLCVVSLAAAFLLLSPMLAPAQTYYWQSLDPSADWSNAANWSGGVPTASTSAYITNGGTANITTMGPTCYTLSLGSTAGSGTVQMTGGAFNAAGGAYVGDSGTGTFTQSGGTSQASLFLGYNSSGSGTYNLSGGFLSTINAYVGYSGTGAFTQTGGTNASTFFYMGYNSGANGTYSLGGTGQLSASQECVGCYPSASALFQQTGGTNTATYISIGSGGRYLLGGGVLQINGFIVNVGVFDLSGGTLQINGPLDNAGVFGVGGAGLLSISNGIIDLSQGTWQNLDLGSLTVNMGANSLLIIPAGFNTTTGFAVGSSLGLTHTAGTTLVVPAGQCLCSQGSVNDPVSCQGTITALHSAYIYLNNGLVLSGTGTVNLGYGSLTVNDSVSRDRPLGSLIGGSQYVGYSGTGTFTQSGGTNTINGWLSLSTTSSDKGTYNLGGGFLNAADIGVGEGGTAAFMQSGGTNATNELDLGGTFGGSGTYKLSGGSLSTTCIQVACWRETNTGVFTQSGGTTSAGTLGLAAAPDRRQPTTSMAVS